MILVGAGKLEAFIAWIEREAPNRLRALRRAIAAWQTEVRNATWQNAAHGRRQYATADEVGNDRIVFDICGNHFRLIVRLNYAAQVAEVRWIGTHDEYDEIDARTI